MEEYLISVEDFNTYFKGNNIGTKEQFNEYKKGCSKGGSSKKVSNILENAYKPYTSK